MNEQQRHKSTSKVIELPIPDSAAEFWIKDVRWMVPYFDSLPTIDNRTYSIEPDWSGREDHRISYTKETAIHQSNTK